MSKENKDVQESKMELEKHQDERIEKCGQLTLKNN